MSLTPQLIEELELLNLFNLDSAQEGIKVHGSAHPKMIAAAERLFAKGITTQADGGYLSDRGLEAAEHVQLLVKMLMAEN